MAHNIRPAHFFPSLTPDYATGFGGFKEFYVTRVALDGRSYRSCRWHRLKSGRIDLDAASGDPHGRQIFDLAEDVMKRLLKFVVFLAASALAIAVARTAAACPFCSAASQTFSEELGTMDVAVIAK